MNLDSRSMNFLTSVLQYIEQTADDADMLRSIEAKVIHSDKIHAMALFCAKILFLLILRSKVRPIVMVLTA